MIHPSSIKVALPGLPGRVDAGKLTWLGEVGAIVVCHCVQANAQWSGSYIRDWDNLERIKLCTSINLLAVLSSMALIKLLSTP